MASLSSKLDHLERTADEPRSKTLHKVILGRIDEISEQIRVCRLVTPEGALAIQFLPGQWLDVFVPGVPKAGGFTITSPPSKANPTLGSPGYLELAIQHSPASAPAAWLWQPSHLILGVELHVRVGGSFVWPPRGVDMRQVCRVVFVAGGVGINPFMSMLSSMAETPDWPFDVRFLYSLKDDPKTERQAARLQFVERLASIFAMDNVRGELRLFLTGGTVPDGMVACNEVEVPFQGRRMALDDVSEALGSARHSAVVYVCGIPTMTDEFVQQLTDQDGLALDPSAVLYEKWW